MSALQQKAISLINKMPEEYLAVIVRQMLEYQEKANRTITNKTITPQTSFTGDSVVDQLTPEEWDEFIYGGSGVDPKKAEGFRKMEELRKRYAAYADPNIDYDQERWEAINEKYGSID